MADNYRPVTRNGYACANANANADPAFPLPPTFASAHGFSSACGSRQSDKILSAGKKYETRCQSTGSRPPAVLTWWKASKQLKKTSENVSKRKDDVSKFFKRRRTFLTFVVSLASSAMELELDVTRVIIGLAILCEGVIIGLAILKLSGSLKTVSTRHICSFAAGKSINDVNRRVIKVEYDKQAQLQDNADKKEKFSPHHVCNQLRSLQALTSK
ncbi:hypothetical protein WN51_08671 [Melipona quadrifasciata]|uniref:CD80-like immunoglobulin C2-set domain-containing protein n=1 Tax=Melipona quadrifasciata TaxID=166423 RepID=A0A0N0BJC3_9HYME|nr:hypothetical protein WN51_08671 [Melipona quadrifasciata]